MSYEKYKTKSGISPGYKRKLVGCSCSYHVTQKGTIMI
jgi:hypothetical protein